jgi:hypothetical protein
MTRSRYSLYDDNVLISPDLKATATLGVKANSMNASPADDSSATEQASPAFDQQ